MNREERTAAAREAIQEATNKGFMNCKSIVRALYPERFPDRRSDGKLPTGGSPMPAWWWSISLRMETRTCPKPSVPGVGPLTSRRS